jgi:hypothetical protein
MALGGMRSYPKNWKYSNAIAEAVINRSVMAPNMLALGPLVCSPMIFLLLQICNTMAIMTGAVTPYRIAEYSSAVIGLMPT